MTRGLAAALTAVFVVACSGAGGPTQTPAAPTATAPPSGTAGPTDAASASPDLTAAPTDAASATPGPATDSPAPASPPAPAGWRERGDVAAGPSAREDHTWTVDGEGSLAYVFGGRGAGGASDELWAFDLVTDTWTQLDPAGAAPEARFGHTATWVPGTGLVVWSGQRGSDFFADIWAYDPAANAWAELPSQGATPPARYGSCASLGPDGRLWISHGFTADSGRFFDTRAYEFATGEWADLTPDGTVPVERCLHDCFWADGRLVLYAGQTTGVPALGDIWSFDPSTSGWTKGPDPEATARQLYALTDLGDGRSLVFGGGSVDGGYLGDAWLIEASSLEISQFDQGEVAPSARSGATLITDRARGRVLLFGGVNSDGALGDLWELEGAL